jgi:hypothetical protein
VASQQKKRGSLPDENRARNTDLENRTGKKKLKMDQSCIQSSETEKPVVQASEISSLFQAISRSRFFTVFFCDVFSRWLNKLTEVSVSSCTVERGKSVLHGSRWRIGGKVDLFRSSRKMEAHYSTRHQSQNLVHKHKTAHTRPRPRLPLFWWEHSGTLRSP